MASEMNNSPVEFTLELEVIPVNLKRKDNPAPWECELREMDGFHRDKFLNTQKDVVKINTREIKDFTDLQSTLIGYCLFERSTGEAVPLKAIREFPSKVQGKLYNMCVDLNGLSEGAEQTLKND